YAGGEKGYSNWELSADRANASRRELIAGGMDESKVMRVLGLASTQNLNKADPLDPENRRISIIVLNKKSEDALMHDDSTTTTLSDDAAGSGKSLPVLSPDAAAGKAAPVRLAPDVAKLPDVPKAPDVAPALGVVTGTTGTTGTSAQ
ncbi:MAG TPA: motility protein MotB, partial [Paraburkholderia sp.]|nr:motility protein MotB [Paraburkholderia sp.]